MICWHADLVGVLHMLVKDGARDGNQTRVRNPGAIMPGPHLTELVLAYAFHGFFVCFGIVSNRNLRSHASHGMAAAFVTGMDSQFDIGTEEWLLHRNAAS